MVRHPQYKSMKSIEVYKSNKTTHSSFWGCNGFNSKFEQCFRFFFRNGCFGHIFVEQTSSIFGARLEVITSKQLSMLLKGGGSSVRWGESICDRNPLNTSYEHRLRF